MHAGPHISAMQWIAATVGLFQGLGVSYAVNCLISVFRLRKQATFDWIPLVWMAICFVLMLQFWWALLELSTLVIVWTVPAFLVVISIPLSLYVAVALFLPAPSSQYASAWADEFWRDGKWGMLALALLCGGGMGGELLFVQRHLVRPGGDGAGCRVGTGAGFPHHTKTRRAHCDHIGVRGHHRSQSSAFDALQLRVVLTFE